MQGCPWWLRCKESACNVGDLGSIPGLGRSPGGGNTPVFLPGEFHGQRSLEGYSLWGCKESDMSQKLSLSEEGMCLVCPRSSKKTSVGTSLVVWWLRIILLMQVSWVQTPVGELRSTMPHGTTKSKKQKQKQKQNKTKNRKTTNK